MLALLCAPAARCRRCSASSARRSGSASPSALEIDGDLSEWIGQPYIPLCSNQQAAYDQAWGGRDDLSAKVHLAWTPRALILAVEVADHVVVGTGPVECVSRFSG